MLVTHFHLYNHTVTVPMISSVLIVLIHQQSAHNVLFWNEQSSVANEVIVASVIQNSEPLLTLPFI